MFAPDARALISSGLGAATRASLLRSGAVREHPRVRGGGGVYTLGLFTPGFCALLAEEARSYAEWAEREAPHRRAGRVNSMHRGGVDLGELGLRDALTAPILEGLVRPLCALLFGGGGGDDGLWLELDAHRAFTVSYDADAPAGRAADRWLAYHWVRSRCARLPRARASRALGCG